MTEAEAILRTMVQPPKPEPEPEYMFIHCPLEVTPGHTFLHLGQSWEVTWCQPGKPSGWMLMLVPR